MAIQNYRDVLKKNKKIALVTVEDTDHILRSPSEVNRNKMQCPESPDRPKMLSPIAESKQSSKPVRTLQLKEAKEG